MPNKFAHHPDGYIIIKNGEIDVQIPLTVFRKWEPSYKDLPEGFIGLEYKQGLEFRYFSSVNEQRNGTDWLEGDFYIGKASEYKRMLSDLENISI